MTGDFMTRQERMVAVAKQRDVPSGYTDFEVIDFMEMKPGISMLTYRYTTTYDKMVSRTARFLIWCNDHNLAGGVLHTDFPK